MQELAGNGASAAEAKKGTRSVYFQAAGDYIDCTIYDREKLGAGATFTGPGIVEEWTSTTVVPPGWQLTVDRYGNLLLTPEEVSA